MKNNLFVACLLLTCFTLLLSLRSYSQKTISYKDSIKQEFNLVNGIRNGTFRSFFTNDTVYEIGNYIDGSRDGLWTRQDKYGYLEMKNIYKTDDIFYSEKFSFYNEKEYKFKELYFKEGIYKVDFESLVSRIDTFIRRNYKHLDDEIEEYYSESTFKRNFFTRYDMQKWANGVDSTIVNWMGISAPNVTIRRFTRLGEVKDSIVFENRKETYREERSYYNRKLNMLFDKTIYINGVISKKFEYLYSQGHYKMSLYTPLGKLESSGEIKNGSKYGNWEYFDKDGNLVKIKRF